MSRVVQLYTRIHTFTFNTHFTQSHTHSAVQLYTHSHRYVRPCDTPPPALSLLFIHVYRAVRCGPLYRNARGPRRRLGPEAAETISFSCAQRHTMCACTASSIDRRSHRAACSSWVAAPRPQSCAARSGGRPPCARSEDQLERPALLAGAAARGQAVNFQTNGHVRTAHAVWHSCTAHNVPESSGQSGGAVPLECP